MSDISATALPRVPLYGAAALVVLILSATTMTRLTGIGRSQVVDAAVVSERSFFAVDQSDGSIEVIDANTKLMIESIAPGTNGFMRGTLRGLARERHRQNQDQTEPFTIASRADGRLTLTDPATRRHVDLGSFGPTNEAAFARLLPGASSAASQADALGTATPAVITPAASTRSIL